MNHSILSYIGDNPTNRFLKNLMTYSLRIADLPPTERPRERLLAIGVKNLTTTELLAILLSTGQG